MPNVSMFSMGNKPLTMAMSPVLFTQRSLDTSIQARLL